MKFFFLYNARDFVEILFFSSLFFITAQWLKKETSKRLLLGFYSYGTLLCFTVFFNLATINTFLLWFSPCLIMLMIVFHEELLQKKFIMTKKIIPARAAVIRNWQEECIRFCLQARSQYKSLGIIIEKEHSLASYINNELPIVAPASRELYSLLFSSSFFNDKTIIWIQSSSAMIAGMNIKWKELYDEPLFDAQGYEDTTFIKQAIKYSKKSDALFLYSSLESFSIIVQGKLIDHLDAAATQSILTQYTNTYGVTTKKGDLYESKPSHYSQKNNFGQQSAKS